MSIRSISQQVTIFCDWQRSCRVYIGKDANIQVFKSESQCTLRYFVLFIYFILFVYFIYLFYFLGEICIYLFIQCFRLIIQLSENRGTYNLYNIIAILSFTGGVIRPYVFFFCERIYSLFILNLQFIVLIA